MTESDVLWSLSLRLVPDFNVLCEHLSDNPDLPDFSFRARLSRFGRYVPPLFPYMPNLRSDTCEGVIALMYWERGRGGSASGIRGGEGITPRHSFGRSSHI